MLIFCEFSNTDYVLIFMLHDHDIDLISNVQRVFLGPYMDFLSFYLPT